MHIPFVPNTVPVFRTWCDTLSTRLDVRSLVVTQKKYERENGAQEHWNGDRPKTSVLWWPCKQCVSYFWLFIRSTFVLWFALLLFECYGLKTCTTCYVIESILEIQFPLILSSRFLSFFLAPLCLWAFAPFISHSFVKYYILVFGHNINNVQTEACVLWHRIRIENPISLICCSWYW